MIDEKRLIKECEERLLVGTWKVDDEGGAFYAPFTGRTYASLGCFVTAWMPLPEPYRPDDSMKDEERLVL